MIPSDRLPGTGELARAREVPSQASRGTLPPPEWRAVPAKGAPASVTPEPLPRRAGARAQEAWLRARVEEARAAGDDAATQAACAALARWLASRDRDLDQAVDLATSALQLREDVELRRELAAWLESLGDAARAAATLRPIASLPDIDAADAAYVLIRTGVLKARCGAAAGAAAAFEAALATDQIG